MWPQRHQGVSCSGMLNCCLHCGARLNLKRHLYACQVNAMVIFLPLSVTKNLDIVSVAAPSRFEKECSSSSRMSTPSRLHSALVLELKLRLLGGGPHVAVTLFPKNTCCGSNCKGVRSDKQQITHQQYKKADFLTLNFGRKVWTFLPSKIMK